jgi:hypothetical protein
MCDGGGNSSRLTATFGLQSGRLGALTKHMLVAPLAPPQSVGDAVVRLRLIGSTTRLGCAEPIEARMKSDRAKVGGAAARETEPSPADTQLERASFRVLGKRVVVISNDQITQQKRHVTCVCLMRWRNECECEQDRPPREELCIPYLTTSSNRTSGRRTCPCHDDSAQESLSIDRHGRIWNVAVAKSCRGHDNRRRFVDFRRRPYAISSLLFIRQDLVEATRPSAGEDLWIFELERRKGGFTGRSSRPRPTESKAGAHASSSFSLQS